MFDPFFSICFNRCEYAKLGLNLFKYYNLNPFP